MSILEARSLFKRFGPIEALSDASMEVDAGEIHALCGENGAGKSTLVKLLTGLYEPDSGAILVDGKECRIRDPQDAQALGIAFVSQELSTVPHLSVQDNIWLGHRDVPLFHHRRALRDETVKALERVGLEGVTSATQAGKLSLAERQLVEIARMLARDARILILDEPTAMLNDREIARVFQALRRVAAEGRAVILITHRLGEVFEVCDRVSVLRNGRDVGSLKTDTATRETLIELMLGRPFGEMYPEAAALRGAPALEVASLTIPNFVYDISVTVARGSIVCVSGQIGSGATEVLRAVAGLVYNAEGDVRVNGVALPLGKVEATIRNHVRFVSEDRAAEGLFLQLPVKTNLTASCLAMLRRWFVLTPRAIVSAAREVANMVGVAEDRLSSLAGQLSGGNQQKVAIGRALAGSAPGGVILMNEPTRGVDVGARADIYKLMRDLCREGYAILMTSSDIEEVVGLPDTVITMFRGNRVAEYRGDAIDRSDILADITHPRLTHPRQPSLEE